MMAGWRAPGPLNIKATLALDALGGTLPRAAMPLPGPIGVPLNPDDCAHGFDAEIELLHLAPLARCGAYVLKQAHPSVHFTSGRRSREDQTRAMAANVVRNRKWIEQTYRPSVLRDQCQRWVDDHPDLQSASAVEAGLLTVLRTAADSELGRFSKHLSGEAFDAQPVDRDSEAIKATIRGLPGLDRFLDSEGGFVRWHVQF
ncbi:MAG: hypothetical protein KGQ77_08335 [Betaproteobacteria bacterium]|nr:hypothetical protein [Betaproteobacteria bacterium]